MPRRLFAQTRRLAFTLVELLVATAIMVILVVLVMYIAIQVFGAFDGAMANLATTSESRRVLNTMEQDLQSAIIRNDGNVWLQVEHSDEVGNVAKAYAPKLMFFTTALDRPTRESGSAERIPGDVCAVSYQIAQRSPFDNPGELIQRIYGFYRALVDAKATFDTALPIVTGSASGSGSGQPPAAFWEGSAQVIDIDGNRTSQALSSWSTELQNFYASNILGISLIFWYYDQDTKATIGLVHEGIATQVNQAYQGANIPLTLQSYSNELRFKAGEIVKDGTSIAGTLRSIDITVTVLSPTGAQILQDLQRRAGASRIEESAFEEVVVEHGKRYSRSVIVYQ